MSPTEVLRLIVQMEKKKNATRGFYFITENDLPSETSLFRNGDISFPPPPRHSV